MWVVLSGLVLRRFVKYRHSRVEVVYALAFFTFGLTDFREAYALQSWLIWLKAANLLALLWLRALVIKRDYSESKLYWRRRPGTRVKLTTSHAGQTPTRTLAELEECRG